MKILFTLLFTFNILASVSFEQFLELNIALQSAFLELRPSPKHQLMINKPIPGVENFWWNLKEVHASYSGYETDEVYTHNIFLFGGYARLDGMTLDGLAITACHEIGHGIGGKPFKETGSSMEGQSDYFATKECLPVVFKYLRETRQADFDSYQNELCTRFSEIDTNFCLRAMAALESDRHFYKYLGDDVFFNVKSEVVNLELDYSPSWYPESQCRFDTSIHGILKLERPRCWYPDGIDREL